jgi:hypothetical protein
MPPPRYRYSEPRKMSRAEIVQSAVMYKGLKGRKLAAYVNARIKEQNAN